MTALLNDDDTEMELREFGKKESVLLKLKEKGLPKYGSLISEEDIQYFMDVDKSSIQFEKWEFSKLQFREIIKGEGFYITSRGKNGDLYILLPHEMPSHNEQKNKAVFRNLKHRQRALHMIDDSILSDEHKKKLEFEILRNASIEIEMATRMKERCR